MLEKYYVVRVVIDLIKKKKNQAITSQISKNDKHGIKNLNKK